MSVTLAPNFPYSPLKIAIAAACLSFGAILPLDVAMAATEISSASQRTFSVSVAPGSLAKVLGQFASQTGIALSFDGTSNALSQRSSGIRGQYSVTGGFQQLLQGTGLIAISKSGSSYTVKQISTDGQNTLPVLNVNAQSNAATMQLEASSSISKFGTSVHETPASISVIDQTFIQDSGAKTLDDALLYTAGAHTENSGFSTRADWITLRGVDDLVTYRDGLRSFSGENGPRVNVYSLDSIEVLKGPSAAMYGQGGLGGLLNTTTKLPQEESQNEVWLQAGNYDRLQAAFDSTGALTDDGTLLYRIVGLQRDSDTQVDYVNDDTYFLAPSLTWKPSDKTSVTLHLHHQEDNGVMGEQILPSAGTLTSTENGTIATSTFVGEPDWDRLDKDSDEASLFIEHQFSQQWQLNTSARHSQSSTVFRSHRTPFFNTSTQPDEDGNITRIIRTLDTDNTLTNFDTHLTGAFAVGPTQHTLTMGADYFESLSVLDNFFLGVGLGGEFNLYNPTYGNVQSDVVDPIDLNDSKIKQTGLYVADHITLDNWALSVALRHDNYRNTQLNVDADNETFKDTETTKQVGLMHHFDNGVSPYLSYAESFTPNTGTDGTEDSNVLNPTKGEQKEVGVKFLSSDRDLELTFGYFDVEQENRISDDVTSGGVRQIGAVVKGWEVEVKKAWQNLTLQASYTDLDTQDKAAGTQIPHMPEKMASVWGQYQLPMGLRIGVGARYKADIVGAGDAPKLPSVTLFDATLGYSIDNWEFSLDTKNLTDKTYIARCRSEGRDCYYGARRTITANGKYYF